MNFQKELFNFSATRPFIVVTDVANYYDSIGYTHLRNIISGISGVQECVLDMLLHVLSALLWQPDYMQRIEVGLPQIDLDAPRLLAHCFLYELDAYLDSTPTGDFARFMDDIDVGVDSIAEAKAVIRDIDLVLQTRQVRLNSGKTLILSQSEANHHFRISENISLDELTKLVEFQEKSGKFEDGTRRKIRLMIANGLRTKKFDGGNGEKILKRLIGLAGRSGTNLTIFAMRNILRLRPSVRPALFKYISKSPLTHQRASVLLELLQSKILVDEAGYTNLVSRLLETITPRSKKIHIIINQIIAEIIDDGFYGFHAGVWAMSKFSSRVDLLDIIESRRPVWTADRRLGRLVGSLAPLFMQTKEWALFLSIVQTSRNTGARDAYLFHTSLERNLNTLKAMMPFLKVSNDSKSTGITHAKFLCLLTALRNPNLNSVDRKKLLAIHQKAQSDGYYRSLLKPLAKAPA